MLLFIAVPLAHTPYHGMTPLAVVEGSPSQFQKFVAANPDKVVVAVPLGQKVPRGNSTEPATSVDYHKAITQAAARLQSEITQAERRRSVAMELESRREYDERVAQGNPPDEEN